MARRGTCTRLRRSDGRKIETGIVVLFISTEGDTEREAGNILAGVLKQVDADNYYVVSG